MKWTPRWDLIVVLALTMIAMLVMQMGYGDMGHAVLIGMLGAVTWGALDFRWLWKNAIEDHRVIQTQLSREITRLQDEMSGMTKRRVRKPARADETE